MLSVWWVVKWIIHWGILPVDCSITADLYCQQLDRVAAKLQGKRDRIYFLHDNARPHIAKSAREKRLKLGWVTVPHPPYSPDLVPTDYRFFRSLSNYLGEKNSTTRTTSKWICSTSLVKSLRTSTNAGSFLYQSVGDKS